MYTNQMRVQHVLSMGTRTDDFNCWGATKFLADPNTDHLEWVDIRAMSEWVVNSFEPISRTNVREGDIVALFDENMNLIHTAYALDRSHFVHKLGRNVARMESLNKVLASYARDTKKYIFLRSNQ